MDIGGDVAAIAGGAVTVLTALGTAIKFVWGKVEARFSEIERRLDECRDDRQLSDKRRGILLTIVELLKQELRHHLPESGTLVRVDELTAEYRALGSGGDDAKAA